MDTLDFSDSVRAQTFTIKNESTHGWQFIYCSFVEEKGIVICIDKGILLKITADALATRKNIEKLNIIVVKST